MTKKVDKSMESEKPIGDMTFLMFPIDPHGDFTQNILVTNFFYNVENL